MNLNSLSKHIKENKFPFLFIAIGVVYILYQFVDVMEVDAAQYALISMEMSFTKSFLHVYQLGHDYLDKPPLLFWLSSLSFMILGISNFAYKLPSLLIAILGIYSTYRFAKLWYSRKTGVFAALILATSQALFLMVNDVRTDTLLLGFTVFSIWQISEYLQTQKWKNLILTALGIGGAMLSKGPIGIVLVVVAVGSDLLIKRQWNKIFKYQWLILLVLIALIILPMSYGLYTQFDLHPEKTVYGLKGPSGIEFYFWTQSFGRITGQNYWSNDSGYFYFLHTILWDFQPWILLFIPALIIRFRKAVLKRISKDKEYISLFGFILLFVAFSFSRYKLPHYIFVLFPFASVITADFIMNLSKKWTSKVSKIQFGLMHVFWVLMLFDFIFIFPPKHFILPLILLIIYVLFVYVFRKNASHTGHRIIIPTVVTAVAFNLLMAVNFYPQLLQYQANSQAGKYISDQKIPLSRVSQPCDQCYSFDFYAHSIQPADTVLSDFHRGDVIFTNEAWLRKIKNQQISYKTLKTFCNFRVTHLNKTFLLKRTRTKVLTKKYIIEIE